MEKKVGRGRWKGFKSSLATKAVVALGVISLLGILGGYTCQTVNTEMVKQELTDQMNAKLNEAKLELKKQVISEFMSKQKIAYTENDFAKFSLQYPASWTIERGQQRVAFSDPRDPFNYFVIEVKNNDIKSSKYYFTQANFSDVTTTVWNGFEAVQYIQKCMGDCDDAPKVLDVFPIGIKGSRTVIHFSGDAKNFEEILKSVSGFKI